MEIIKNDSSFIRSIHATLIQNQSHGFTHELHVKHHHDEINQSNHEISSLIRDHFDLLCNDHKSNDIYKLEDGTCDPDQDGGWSSSSTIKDIEFSTIALEGSYFVTKYKIKLGESSTESF